MIRSTIIPKTIDNYVIDNIIYTTSSNQLNVAHDEKTQDKYVAKFSTNKDILAEYSLMKTIEHKNILHVLQSYEFQKEKLFCYMMPFAEGGDLFSFFDDNAQNHINLPESHVRDIMIQLFEAIKYIHQKKYVHHDIKPENIFFMNNDKKSHVVIADFGLARRIEDINNKEIIGTVAYLPPEVLLRQQYDSKIDCWALGIIMYMLLYNSYPFTQKLNRRNEWWNVSKIKRADFCFKENFRSKSAEDLIRHLICADPNERFSVYQALNHEWFAQSFENIDIKSQNSQTILTEMNKSIVDMAN